MCSGDAGSSGRPGEGRSWNGQGQRHASQGGMHAGFEHEEPQHGSEREIGRQPLDPDPVENGQESSVSPARPSQGSAKSAV